MNAGIVNEDVSDVGENRVLQMAILAEKKEEVLFRLKKAQEEENNEVIRHLQNDLTDIKCKIFNCVSGYWNPGLRPST